MTDKPTRYYTLAEVASELRVSDDTIRRMIVVAKNTKKPIGFKVRRQWRFTREDIERMTKQ